MLWDLFSPFIIDKSCETTFQNLIVNVQVRKCFALLIELGIYCMCQQTSANDGVFLRLLLSFILT